jgi:hypothetical protein
MAVAVRGGQVPGVIMHTGRVFPVTQDEHGGDIHGEHVEPDIPGAWPAVDVHGGGAVLTVSRRAAPVTPWWSW